MRVARVLFKHNLFTKVPQNTMQRWSEEGIRISVIFSFKPMVMEKVASSNLVECDAIYQWCIELFFQRLLIRLPKAFTRLLRLTQSIYVILLHHLFECRWLGQLSTVLTKNESPHTGYTFTPWVVSFTRHSTALMVWWNTPSHNQLNICLKPLTAHLPRGLSTQMVVHAWSKMYFVKRQIL